MESALKQDLAPAKAAFQRPGFVTFKSDRPLDSMFARVAGVTLERLSKEDAENPRRVEALFGAEPDVVHVFARDTADDNERAALEATRAQLAVALPWPNVATENGQRVADVIVVEPEVVYVGAHTHDRSASPYAGALLPLAMPQDAPSRAWLKLEDALHRFQLSPQPGEIAVEIGAAPGGAAFALCSRGLFTHGVDPAAMSPNVLALRHPNGDRLYTHVQKPFAHVGKRDLPAHADYLLLDVNVAPRESGEMAKKCIGLFAKKPRVCLLTFKLGSKAAAADVRAEIARLGALGYRDVRARQLASSHKEIVVCAR